jgi:hypothetical protein
MYLDGLLKLDSLTSPGEREYDGYGRVVQHAK